MTVSEEVAGRIDWASFYGRRIPGFRQNGAANIQFKCPFHDDREASASLNRQTGLWKCHACDVGGDAVDFLKRSGMSFQDAKAELYAEAGLTPTPAPPKGKRLRREDAVAVYPYHAPDGSLAYEVLRFEPKTFRPYTPGKDLPGLADSQPRYLFGLPALRDAIAGGCAVYLVEGEKDALRLNEDLDGADLIATTWAGGADGWRKYAAAYVEQLRGAKAVRIIQDADEAGRRVGAAVYKDLSAAGLPVEVFESARGKDYSDHADAGLRLSQLAPVTDAVKKAAGDEPELDRYQLKRVDLVALSKKKFPPLVPILPGWHIDDIALLVAAGGTVKSSLIDYLTLCLAFGLPIFGVEAYRPRERYRISICHEEENEDGAGKRWQRIERALGLDPADYAEFVFMNEFQSGLNMSNPEHLEALHQHCREFRPHHIFIDGIGQASGIVEPNKGPLVREFFARGPMSLRRKYGTGSTFLAHVNKNAFSKIPTMHRLGQVLNSIEFVNCPDSIQFAWGVPGKPEHRQLHFLKPRRCSPQPGIEFRFVNSLYDPDFGDQEQPFRFDFVKDLPPGGDDAGPASPSSLAPDELGPDARKVADHLRAHDGRHFTKEELVASCKVSLRTVGTALSNLPGLSIRNRAGSRANEYGLEKENA